MPDYRRAYVEGGTFFFTVVTYNRLPLFNRTDIRKMLRCAAWMNIQKRFPFKIEAVCLLPEHIRCIWTLLEGDSNYSIRWKENKLLFTKGYLSTIGPVDTRNVSRRKRGEADASRCVLDTPYLTANIYPLRHVRHGQTYHHSLKFDKQDSSNSLAT